MSRADKIDKAFYAIDKTRRMVVMLLMQLFMFICRLTT